MSVAEPPIPVTLPERNYLPKNTLHTDGEFWVSKADWDEAVSLLKQERPTPDSVAAELRSILPNLLAWEPSLQDSECFLRLQNLARCEISDTDDVAEARALLDQGDFLGVEESERLIAEVLQQPDEYRIIADKALLLAARWFKLNFEDETLDEHPPSKADLAGMFDAMQEARNALLQLGPLKRESITPPSAPPRS